MRQQLHQVIYLSSEWCIYGSETYEKTVRLAL